MQQNIELFFYTLERKMAIKLKAVLENCWWKLTVILTYNLTVYYRYWHVRPYITLNFEANKKEISPDNMFEGYYNLEPGSTRV